MAIKVIAPGLATTVQDLGRPGYYHLGIPISGAMDRYSLRSANLLVGNDEGAAALEAVFLGPELEFTRDAMVAVTGAELPPNSPLKKAPLTGFHRTAKHIAAKAVSPSSEMMRTT
jgi:allophanate hydrolase subunit 2